GAVVLRHDPDGDPDRGVVFARTYLDGEFAPLILSLGLGTDSLPGEERSPCLVNGSAIQKYVIQHLPCLVLQAMEEVAIRRGPPFWFIPHNSNLRMVPEIGERIGLSADRVLTALSGRGNMSSASIPVTLVEEIRKGTFRSGDILVLAGFGAGMTAGIVIYV